MEATKEYRENKIKDTKKTKYIYIFTYLRAYQNTTLHYLYISIFN